MYVSQDRRTATEGIQVGNVSFESTEYIQSVIEQEKKKTRRTQKQDLRNVISVCSCNEHKIHSGIFMFQ